MTDKIFDWKGNEVKSGMTIYFPHTKPGLLESSRMGLLMPGTGETIWEDENEWQERKNKEIWELGNEYLVIQRRDGQLCVQFTDGEMTIVVPFNQFGGGEKQLIAIKGISDKKPNQ